MDYIKINVDKNSNKYTLSKNSNTNTNSPITNFSKTHSINNNIEVSEINFDSINKEEVESSIKGHASNNYSDADNIFINDLGYITNNIHDGFTNKEYEIFCQFCEGKKLSDLVNDDGSLKEITKEDFSYLIKENNITEEDIDTVIKAYNKCINSLRKERQESKVENSDIYNNGHAELSNISDNLLNSKIEKIVTKDCYDAFLLTNSEGNLVCVNSGTNPANINDLAADLYPLLKQFGLTKFLYDNSADFMYLLDIMNNFDIGDNMADTIGTIISNGGINYFEECYNKQLNANKELLEEAFKLAEERGCKLELNGYSLGGGLQLTSYAELCLDHPEYEDLVQSVTVFNPFVSFAEQSTKGSSAVEYLASSEKLTIFSNQEDFVSTFNNSVELLEDKYVFIKAPEIEGDVFESSSLEPVCNLIINILKLINNGSLVKGAVNLIGTGKNVLVLRKAYELSEQLDNLKIELEAGNIDEDTFLNKEKILNETLIDYQEDLDSAVAAIERILNNIENNKLELATNSLGFAFNASKIFDIMLGNNSNHFLTKADLSTFDEFGNIIDEGEYINPMDVLAKSTGNINDALETTNERNQNNKYQIGTLDEVLEYINKNIDDKHQKDTKEEIERIIEQNN